MWVNPANCAGHKEVGPCQFCNKILLIYIFPLFPELIFHPILIRVDPVRDNICFAFRFQPIMKNSLFGHESEIFVTSYFDVKYKDEEGNNRVVVLLKLLHLGDTR